MRRKRMVSSTMRIIGALAVVAVWCGNSGSLAAQDERNLSDAQTLQSSPWYDAESGRVVPIEVEPVTDDSLNRDSRWLPKAKQVAKPPSPASSTTNSTTGGGGVFGSNLTLGNLLGWLLLIVLLAAGVGGLIYALSRAEMELVTPPPSVGGRNPGAGPDEQMLQRIKHLPAELRRSDVNLRDEAERLMHAGHFDEAIILLFGHQLLMLDHAGMLRLNRGKTNRKYVRETRAVDSRAAELLAETVDAFESSYFGRHSITASRFDALWQANRQLEQSVHRHTGAAA